MYFIKCNHCGFENPLKSEYLTFCSNCGKKLQYSFQEWKQLHPSGNFEEFKKSAATHIPEIKPVRYSKRARHLPGLFLLLIFTAGTGWILLRGNFDLAGIFLPAKVPESLLEKKWEKHTYGHGLTLEVPERLKETGNNFSDIFAGKIQEAAAFEYRPSQRFRMQAASILYKEGVPVNLNIAAINTINSLVSRNGISNIEFRQSPLLSNDINGVLFEGTCNEGEYLMHFSCAVFANSSNSWSVLVMYPDSDGIAKEVAERIMTSIEINFFVKTI